MTERRGRDGDAEPVTISWHDGDRHELRALFELADDSPSSVDRSIDAGRVLVARDGDGTIVGHLQLVAGPRTGSHEITNIAVREPDQGRGIGRQLVERALTECRDAGGQTVTAVTAMADIGNLRFYQRCGFRAVDVIPDAFTEAAGYPPNLVADGIPVLDAIRFSCDLRRGGVESSEQS